MRDSLKRSLVAAVVILASVVFAAPAQAATYPSYSNRATGECLEGRNGDYILFTYACDSSSEQDWEIESRPQSGTSNDVVKLRNIRYNRCLDSHAGAADDPVYNIGCNTGNYQLWEVFYNSNGSRTFKSWGAWKNQGRHLCLAANPSGADYQLLVRTCNANASAQQWNKR